MNRIADVKALSVPRNCVDDLHAHLRKVGREGHEGLGLWVGRQAGDHFQVHKTLIPAQRHIRTADGVCVVTGPEELHRINVWLYRQQLALIAQIHSHPGRAYHSSTDDEYAIATTVGCLSLVVPDFARAPFDLRNVASYRLDGRGVWRALTAGQVEQMISIKD
jgi:Prokaryotic homologs of the JAB domain